MAIKLKVKHSLGILENLKQLNAPANNKKIGDLTVRLMKDAIARGLSPVRQFGRFEEYSAAKRNRASKKSRSSAKQGYPFNVLTEYPNKKVRPVNLELSGKMLNALTSKSKSDSVVVGIFNKTQEEKARGHQLGDAKKNLPKRRFVPTASGEQFIVSIQREIRQLYSELLDAIIKLNK